jgi:hypothetical protein
MNCVRICHKKSFANPISSQNKILRVKKNSFSNLIFTACVTCKNQVPNRLKIKYRWIGTVHNHLKGGGGKKLPILLSKKTTNRGGGGCKTLLILRRHSFWMAP